MSDDAGAGRLHRAGQWQGPADDRLVLDYEGRFLRRKRVELASGAAVLIDLPETVSLARGRRAGNHRRALIEIDAAPEPLMRVTAELPACLAQTAKPPQTPAQIRGDQTCCRADIDGRHCWRIWAPWTAGGRHPYARGRAYGHGRTHGPRPSAREPRPCTANQPTAHRHLTRRRGRPVAPVAMAFPRLPRGPAIRHSHGGRPRVAEGRVRDRAEVRWWRPCRRIGAQRRDRYAGARRGRAGVDLLGRPRPRGWPARANGWETEAQGRARQRRGGRGHRRRRGGGPIRWCGAAARGLGCPTGRGSLSAQAFAGPRRYRSRCVSCPWGSGGATGAGGPPPGPRPGREGGGTRGLDGIGDGGSRRPCVDGP